jgi:hypothetical protein
MTMMMTTNAYADKPPNAPSQDNCEGNPNCLENRDNAAWCATSQAENLGPGQGYGGLTIPELAPGAKAPRPCGSGGTNLLFLM